MRTFKPVFLLNCFLLVACSTPTINKISLNPSYLQNGGLIDFQLASEFNAKVDADDSFLVYLYSPTCSGCLTFKPRLEAFATHQDVQVFTLNVSMLEYTYLNGTAKYTPSLYLYAEGELAFMLDPRSDEKGAFNSEEAFTAWFNARVERLEV